MLQQVHTKPKVSASIGNVSLKTANTLLVSDLMDLFEEKIYALRVLNYYPLAQAEQVSQKLIQDVNLERYRRVPDLGVIRSGITFFETNGSIDMLERYYKEAPEFIQNLRKNCFPFLSPIDKLRLDLGDMWLAGAYIEDIHQRRMLAGISRVFEDGFELPPHQDMLVRDILDGALPPSRLYEDLKTQVSGNVYLRCPEVGGELEIWDLKPDRVEQQSIRDDEYQYEGIIDRESLPSPAVVIKPEVGDLILFDSGRIHAVRSSVGGPRVSVSMFVGYRGVDKPLTYWN